MVIPFDKLFPRHNIRAKGVLHIGASTGQEAPEYAKQGIQNMLFIEAIPSVYEDLKRFIAPYPNALAINACIGDEDGKEVTFHVANNGGQSSSYLELGTHAQAHPSVKYQQDIKMFTKRIDTLYSELFIPPFAYDFLNIDLQGAELFALRGMGDLLHNFKYAYLEVNEKELYKGCALIGEVDEYMKRFGFRRVETYIYPQWGWGDALFKK
jgi:FkbM family methyltransferase